MIIYFSGTGNSRYCAKLLGQKLDDSCLDSFNFIRDGIAADLITGPPWIFVSPTYAWRLPHVFEDFIRRGDFKGNEDAYFVMTCGDDIGNAAKYLRRLCEEKGLKFRGVLPVVMPENYIAMFDAPSDAEAVRIIDVADRALKKAAAGTGFF